MRKLTLVPPRVQPAEEYVPPSDMYRDLYRETDQGHVVPDKECRRCYGPMVAGQQVFFLKTDVRIYYVHVDCPEDEDD